MNENSLLNQAIELARQAHANQVDKAGKPYLEHPWRVMNAVTTISEKIVAILHDAVEDSDLSLECLKKQGFTEDIIEAIDAITKRDGEPYSAYLERVKANPLSLRVKIADMRDNMDMGRIANPTKKDYQRLRKYQDTLPKLLQALESYPS